MENKVNLRTFKDALRVILSTRDVRTKHVGAARQISDGVK
jgi:hypothetical protein